MPVSERDPYYLTDTTKIYKQSYSGLKLIRSLCDECHCTFCQSSLMEKLMQTCSGHSVTTQACTAASASLVVFRPWGFIFMVFCHGLQQSYKNSPWFWVANFQMAHTYYFLLRMSAFCRRYSVNISCYFTLPGLIATIVKTTSLRASIYWP